MSAPITLPPPQPYPAAYYGVPPASMPQPKNGLGIAALVLGLAGLLFGPIPLTGFIAIVLGIIGLVLGLVGIGRIRKHIATNRVLTWFGVATSLGAIVLGVIGLVILANAVDDAVDEIDSALADEAANDRPTEITEGAAFNHDIWQVQNGWRLTDDQFGSSIGHIDRLHRPACPARRGRPAELRQRRQDPRRLRHRDRSGHVLMNTPGDDVGWGAP